MADIFREIDEDLRRDRAARLWQRHGRWLIAAAVVIVLVTAAFVAWRDWQRRGDEALGLKYAAAAAEAHGDPAKAIVSFEALAAESHVGYGELARLDAALLKAKGSDVPGGIAALKAIAADAKLGQIYRDFATLLAALYAVDTQPPAETIAHLAALTLPSNPWRHTALELTALAQLKNGDQAAAISTYQKLADDLAAPPTLRARATELIAALQH